MSLYGTVMSDSNWGWIESINPSGVLGGSLSRGRYGRRLGSFWDGRIARQVRPVYDSSGELIIRTRTMRATVARIPRKSRVAKVEVEVTEFRARYMKEVNTEWVIDGDRGWV